jgi:Kef-type K+ transport system membrane component KefB
MLEVGATLVVVSLAAFSLPLLGERLRVPSVVLEIGFGIVLSPFVSFLPATDLLSALAGLGFFLLLFLAGFEIDIDAIRGDDRSMLAVAGAGFVGTLGLAWVASTILGYGIFVAFMLATTSVGVVLPTLRRRRLESTKVGRAILTGAILADFLTLLSATFYAALTSGGGGIELLLTPLLFLSAAVALMALRRSARLGSGLRRRIFSDTDPEELGTRAALAIMFVFAGIAEIVGLEPILGAFLAGLVLNVGIGRPRAVLRRIGGLAYGFLIPVFFIDVGLHFQLDALTRPGVPGLLGGLLIAALVVKLVPSYLFMLLGLSFRETTGIGVLLSARLSLIIAVAELGVELGLIGRSVEGAVIVLALVTTSLAPTVFVRLVPGLTPDAVG